MDKALPPHLQKEGGVAKEFADAIRVMGRVRSVLCDLLESVDHGDTDGTKALAAEHARLMDAIDRAFRTEQKFDDWLAKQTGAGADGALDLADIRHQIGCRLARLRTCGGAG
ncbi:hypothetical protein [Pseudoroseicyclus sp. CXY001]|uniref:hypothetical protein n=1 Tax=Pseudoroseicyclus sp. CXY001 TaxID=3242492 RepID=UPI0035713277